MYVARYVYTCVILCCKRSKRVTRLLLLATIVISVYDAYTAFKTPFFAVLGWGFYCLHLSGANTQPSAFAMLSILPMLVEESLSVSNLVFDSSVASYIGPCVKGG
jgi:hypothetical protein